MYLARGCVYTRLTKVKCFFYLFTGADTGGVDRVDIHPPFFSKKKFEMSLYLK